MHDIKSIQEIMGTFTRPGGGPTPLNPGILPSQTNFPHQLSIHMTGANIRNCRTMEGWQQQIVRSLQGTERVSGNDQYIIARPGGGKTMPLICHWTHNLLNLQTMGRHAYLNNNADVNAICNTLFSIIHPPLRKRLPKVLVMVPVIALAQQTAADFRSDLANILFQTITQVGAYVLDARRREAPDQFFRKVLQALGRHNRGLERSYEIVQQITREIRRLTPSTAIGQPVNPSSHEINRLYSTLQSETQNYNTAMSNTIRTLVDDLVFLRTSVNPTSLSKVPDAIVYVSIFESARNYAEKIENLALTIIDEAHLIQDSGVLGGSDNRLYNINRDLYIALSYKVVKKSRLVLLSGTVNPKSAENVMQYLNKKFGRNFNVKAPQIAPESAQNRSKITIVPNESIRTIDGIVNQIIRSVSQNDWGQLIIVFSQKQINQICEICIQKLGRKNVEHMSAGGAEYDRTFAGLGQHRRELRKPGDISIPTSYRDGLSIPQNLTLDVPRITNVLLRESVSAGIGFITRNAPGTPFDQDRKMLMTSTDRMIVTKLYRDKKISVLLATDAVGIGVNINVKDLYIPSLQKFNKNQEDFVTMSLRDLAQLLNRAGRGSTPIATVHTPRENMELVANGLYAGPEDFPEVGVVGRTEARWKSQDGQTEWGVIPTGINVAKNVHKRIGRLSR